MGQAYRLTMHAINLSASPHPEGAYEKLLQRIFRATQPIQIWGERHALMTELSWERGRRGAFGTISTFTDIDKEAPWLNQSTGKAAEESETAEIEIPENLKPHFAQFRFYFDVDTHTLTFQGLSRMPVRTGGYRRYSLTPRHVEIYFNVALRLPGVLGDLSLVNVTIVPDPAKLSQIINNRNIRELTLTVVLPNSDNLATERGRVRQRMEKLRIKRKVEKLTAIDDDGIVFDEELRTEAQVAARDGRVDARVQVGERVELMSTADTPLVESVTVDTDIEEESTTVQRELKAVAARLKSEG